MKSEIVKLRKQIYKNLKEHALSFEEFNEELSTYLKDQIKYSKRKFQISHYDKLKTEVMNSDIVYIGDFHTFDQNIRTVLRVIKLIITNKTNCIIGLEMVPAKYQLYINSYLEKHITELEFLELIHYHDSWRFPWTHYKLIFELARESNISVIGLNIEGSLKARDEFAAKKLVEIYEKNPDSIIISLYGELHITPNKIPKLVETQCPDINHLILHQNLDDVYWRLLKKNLEQGIISFNKKEFCIISAPPWIKYESMIYWYENMCEDPDFDIHEYIIENGKKIFSDNTDENFQYICNMLIKHLSLKDIKDEIEDFNLYDHTNLDFVEEKLATTLKPSVFKFYDYLISTNKSFRFPKNSTFYCSSYSMNRISYLAGIHILHIYLNKNQIDVLSVLNSKSSTQKLILFTLESMCAFFISKIINPHRKCDMYKDLKKKLNSGNIKKVDEKILTCVLNILKGKNITTEVTGAKVSQLYEVSLFLGHILGEYLYLHMNKSNQSFFNHNIKAVSLEKKYFDTLLKNILKNIDFKNHYKRYF